MYNTNDRKKKLLICAEDGEKNLTYDILQRKERKKEKNSIYDVESFFHDKE